MTHESKRDHVRFRAPATLVCERCDDEYEVTLPVPVYLLVAIGKAYAQEHEGCEGKEATAP